MTVAGIDSFASAAVSMNTCANSQLSLLMAEAYCNVRSPARGRLS
jgi:hypothetical protein